MVSGIVSVFGSFIISLSIIAYYFLILFNCYLYWKIFSRYFYYFLCAYHIISFVYFLFQGMGSILQVLEFLFTLEGLFSYLVLFFFRLGLLYSFAHSLFFYSFYSFIITLWVLF